MPVLCLLILKNYLDALFKHHRFLLKGLLVNLVQSYCQKTHVSCIDEQIFKTCSKRPYLLKDSFYAIKG